jgi:probable DNA metabolism protein
MSAVRKQGGATLPSDALVRIGLQPGADAAGFRDAARRLIGQQTPPEHVVWDEGGGDLFGEPTQADAAPLMLPKAAAELIRLVVCHAEPERYGLLYTLIWRLTHGERALLEIASDPLVHRLQRMVKSVRRDLHKMHAYVRFRRLETPGGERFVAWFEPDHWIVEATAQFFVDRFRGMDWAILTPRGSLHWDRKSLRIGPAASRADAPSGDDFEAHWLDYYASIFNPARLNPDVMRGHMAVKYWKNLPEAALIPGLIREAPARVQEMIEREAAMPIKRNPLKAVAAMTDQAPKSLEALNRLILASEPPAPFSPRAVLGEGPIGAAIALVGEQPGDQEDVEGHPFIGPAGQLLDRALAEAGIARAETYVTNAVKNFKFKPVGKRRIHQTPTTGEIKHYRWWLERELEFVQPRLVIALGGSATQALAGKAMPVMKNRGQTNAFGAWNGFITVHPSSLLRLPDEAAKAQAYAAFVSDLASARRLAEAA